MASETKDLEDRLDTLLESTEQIRHEIKTENTRTAKRIRTNRLVTFVVAVLGAIGILIGGIGVHSAHDARDSARKANAAVVSTNNVLATSRVASCNAYNANQDHEAGAQKGLIRVVVTAVTKNQPQTPRLKLGIKEFYVTYDKKVDSEYAHRDCSPAGIASFLHIPQSPQTTVPSK